jgi:hypothetical protein
VIQLSSSFQSARLIEETEWCYEISFLILSLRAATPAAKRCADVAEVCCMGFEYYVQTFKEYEKTIKLNIIILKFNILHISYFSKGDHIPQGMFLKSNYNAVRR